MNGENETTGNEFQKEANPQPNPPEPAGDKAAGGSDQGRDRDLPRLPDAMPLPAKAMVESLLFVADAAVELDRITGALEIKLDAVEQALQELAEEYKERGVRLQRKGRRVQLVTAPEVAQYVRRFLGLELTGRLSPAALETLAIVAYRQPVTRSQVESIRGVNSDSVVRTLVNRGLVEEIGRLEQVGRPIIYGTTFEFLQQFGLTGLEQLPPLELDSATATALVEAQKASDAAGSAQPGPSSAQPPEQGSGQDSVDTSQS